MVGLVDAMIVLLEAVMGPVQVYIGLWSAVVWEIYIFGAEVDYKCRYSSHHMLQHAETTLGPWTRFFLIKIMSGPGGVA
jgi:hypothetical protein